LPPPSFRYIIYYSHFVTTQPVVSSQYSVELYASGFQVLALYPENYFKTPDFCLLTTEQLQILYTITTIVSTDQVLQGCIN